MSKEKKPPQKVQERRKKNKEHVLRLLRETPIVQMACRRVGIHRSTYYRWRKEDDEFKKKADKALEKGRKLVNDLAESQLIKNIKDQNMSAIRFWLKNNHSIYANKLAIEGKITHSKELTDKQKEMMRQALQKGLTQEDDGSK